MIELPRAALRAGELAEYADFFSFGTNDLTQTTLGFSRDDAESAFLATYLEDGVIERNPFASIDVDGVGELVRVGVERGRAARPDIKLGICGEHGGDPASVAFFHRVGLDYVSCSPFRVPIARLAAARAALGDRRVSEPAIDAALTPGEALAAVSGRDRRRHDPRDDDGALRAAPGLRRGDLLRQRRRRARRGGRDRRRRDPRGRARVRAHRRLPPRQLAARVRRRPAARRRARADDDQRHAGRPAGAGRGRRRARRGAREPLGDRRVRGPADAQRAAGAWPCAARACAAPSRSTTPIPPAGSSMRSTAYLPEWPVGDAAERWRVRAQPPTRRPTAR